MTRQRLVLTGGKGFVGQELLHGSDFPERYDIRVCDRVEELAKLGHWAVDATLLHLAGRFSGSKEDLWSSNVDLSRKALHCFSRSGGKRMVFLSTGAVYGAALHPDGSRENDPVRPTNFYGYTKCVAEMAIEFEWGADGNTWHILRLPNVYGENQEKGVIFAMQQRIREHGEVIIEGDGEQRRDFLHVSDLLRAIDGVLAIGAPSGIYNISSHLTLTINQLVDFLTAGKSVRRTYGPDNNGLRELVLDISKAEQQLGFEPMVNELRF